MTKPRSRRRTPKELARGWWGWRMEIVRDWNNGGGIACVIPVEQLPPALDEKFARAFNTSSKPLIVKFDDVATDNDGNCILLVERAVDRALRRQVRKNNS